jgi:putative transposase
VLEEKGLRNNGTDAARTDVGALANLGFLLSNQTVDNILRRHGLSPAPKRKQAICWKDFIRSHMEVLVGTDFFTVEVLTLKSLVTYYVLFSFTWRVGG